MPTKSYWRLQLNSAKLIPSILQNWNTQRPSNQIETWIAKLVERGSWIVKDIIICAIGYA